MKLTLICLLAGMLVLTGCGKKLVEDDSNDTNTDVTIIDPPSTVKEYLELHEYKIRKDGRKYLVWDGNGNLLLDASVSIGRDSILGKVIIEGKGISVPKTIKDATFIMNSDGSMNVKVKNIGTALLKFDAAGNLISIEE